MLVFLTGATGFVGHHVLQELLREGHTVRCLVRKGSLEKLPVPPDQVTEVDSSKEIIVSGVAPSESHSGHHVQVVYGDVTNLESMEGDLRGCDAVIHLVGIIEEARHNNVTFENIHVRGTRTVVEQAKAAEISRFVFMSANGARRDPDASRYHSTKWKAEEMVREAGFERAVIFRPSIIFGDPGEGRPEFASRLADTLIRPFPVVPVLGDGTYRLQPVHISVMAKAFVRALDLEMEAGSTREYCVAGPDEFTFDEVLDRIAEGMGRSPRPKAHLPLWLSKGMVNSFGAMGLMPISPAQFRMLIDGNTCDASDFERDFQPADIRFEPDQLAYLRDA